MSRLHGSPSGFATGSASPLAPFAGIKEVEHHLDTSRVPMLFRVFAVTARGCWEPRSSGVERCEFASGNSQSKSGRGLMKAVTPSAFGKGADAKHGRQFAQGVQGSGTGSAAALRNAWTTWANDSSGPVSARAPSAGRTINNRSDLPVTV